VFVLRELGDAFHGGLATISRGGRTYVMEGAFARGEGATLRGGAHF
jgi:hypothetical protein